MLKALTFALAVLLAPAAQAQVLSSNGQEPFVAELIGAGPQADGSQLAGIRITLEPGWKTYWRNPGGGGIAPRFDWSRSKNLKSVAYIWPAPTIFETYGTVSIGYAKELVLPVVMRAKNPSQPIEARLNMEFGVCSDLCIPAQARIATEVFSSNAAHAKTVKASIGRRAATAREAGLKTATCSIALKDGDEFLLSTLLEFRAAPKGRQILVVETGSEDIWVSETDTVVKGARVSSQADLVNFGDRPMALSLDQLRLTLIGGGGAVDIRGCTG